MSADYDQFLNAAISYLEQLKAQGTRFVPVSAETLAGLGAEQARIGVAPRPATQVRSSPQTESVPQHTPAPVVQAPVTARPAQPPMHPVSPSITLTGEAKAEAIAQLRERALVCVKCPNLAASRKNVVFGVGDINTSIMFVGEAPG
ncbi:MAG TPA: hypothetical protein VMZ27_02265, partial [Candidatus Saccharimonadales bacterium]|nr:hypothetical protein [Candidatus Saccharimonadales bacterium]